MENYLVFAKARSKSLFKLLRTNLGSSINPALTKQLSNN